MRGKYTTYRAAVLSMLLGTSASVYADDQPHIVPERERDIAAEQAAPGPTANKGIKAVVAKGSVDLSNEFAGLDGRALRAREILIEPGGVVAVHQHEHRPGVAYILEGEIIEHRSDSDVPVLRQVGDVAFEKTGVTHWWENVSNAMVRALIVDIVPIQ